jgi:hypothetical protein
MARHRCDASLHIEPDSDPVGEIEIGVPRSGGRKVSFDAPAVWPALPGKELPYYRRLPESPEVPAESGIALTIERVISLKPESRVILRGSFRLPVSDRDVVPAAEREGEYEYDLGYLRPTAVVPITIVAAGSDLLGPVQFNLRVPSYSEIDRSASERTANGFFTIDLFQLEDMPHEPQTYFFYAFSGESFTGPALSALVREPG